jgi:ABC-type transport system involved in cytochrome c biogenesis permease subunit
VILKLTLQGGLIYLTLTLFVATALARGVRQRAVGRGFWFVGFLVAAASVVWRGVHTGHPPMQNLFEFFLCMAAALWPLSQWSRKHNGVDTDLQDALLGVLILIPAGFVFSEEVRRLPPALQSPIFIPHVASYVAGYVMLARAALMALPMMRDSADEVRVRQADAASRQTAVVGFCC